MHCLKVKVLKEEIVRLCESKKSNKSAHIESKDTTDTFFKTSMNQKKLRRERLIGNRKHKKRTIAEIKEPIEKKIRKSVVVYKKPVQMAIWFRFSLVEVW